MIILIQGTPGSGKSYEATVYHALRAVKRGRKVITNLPLNPSAFGQLDPEFEELIEMRDDPDPETPIFSRLEHYQSSWVGRDPDSGKEMGPIYIIDECHRSLGHDIIQKDVADWFAMHRHKGCDVVIMTQNHSDVAKTITNRVDHLVQVENLKRKGMGNVYMRRVYSDCGFRPRLEGQMTRTYSKNNFALYSSYTQGGSGLELGSSDARKWYLEPRLLMIGVILVGALGMSMHGIMGMIERGSTPLTPKLPNRTRASSAPAAAPKVVQTTPLPKSASTIPVAPVVTFVEDLSNLSSLRYAGVLSSSNGNLFLFSKEDGRPLVYSSADLKDAGYTVVSVASCRITLESAQQSQMISC